MQANLLIEICSKHWFSEHCFHVSYIILMRKRKLNSLRYARIKLNILSAKDIFTCKSKMYTWYISTSNLNFIVFMTFCSSRRNHFIYHCFGNHYCNYLKEFRISQLSQDEYILYIPWVLH